MRQHGHWDGKMDKQNTCGWMELIASHQRTFGFLISTEGQQMIHQQKFTRHRQPSRFHDRLLTIAPFNACSFSSAFEVVFLKTFFLKLCFIFIILMLNYLFSITTFTSSLFENWKSFNKELISKPKADVVPDDLKREQLHNHRSTFKRRPCRTSRYNVVETSWNSSETHPTISGEFVIKRILWKIKQRRVFVKYWKMHYR